MTRKLEICSANAGLGSAAALAVLVSRHPDVQTKEWGCLGNCHRCFRAPFLLVDECHPIEADSAEELTAKVAAHLSRTDAGTAGKANDAPPGSAGAAAAAAAPAAY
ncbi:MAG: DUF1450 domain-containing protein [Bacilli bacterium]